MMITNNALQIYPFTLATYVMTYIMTIDLCEVYMTPSNRSDPMHDQVRMYTSNICCTSLLSNS